jgi:hypothetical protein
MCNVKLLLIYMKMDAELPLVEIDELTKEVGEKA